MTTLKAAKTPILCKQEKIMKSPFFGSGCRSNFYSTYIEAGTNKRTTTKTIKDREDKKIKKLASF